MYIVAIGEAPRSGRDHSFKKTHSRWRMKKANSVSAKALSISSDQGDLVMPISDVLRDYRKYYLDQKKRIKRELGKLPAKGSVCRRRIKGHIYYYLVYRDEQSKFCSKYLGKQEPVELKKKIDRRRLLIKELRKVEAALYALGVAKRADHVGLAKRFAVFERDRFTCQYCGRNVKDHGIVLVVDHVEPKKRGGSDSIDNLVAACFECNSGKRATLVTLR